MAILVAKKTDFIFQFNTDTRVYNLLAYSKSAYFLHFMNKVLNSREFIKIDSRFVPFDKNILRITRYPIDKVQDLINLQENSVLKGGGHKEEPITELYGCVSKLLQTVLTFNERKASPCPEPDCLNMINSRMDIAAYNTTSVSGSEFSVVCNKGYRIPFINKDATTVKCSNGTWSGPFQCSKLTCPSLNALSESLSQFIISGAGSLPLQIEPGFTTNITCLSGFFFRGKVTTQL